MARKVRMPHIKLELKAVFPKTHTYALSLFLFSRITLDNSYEHYSLCWNPSVSSMP
jgi:hypothetical protein